VHKDDLYVFGGHNGTETNVERNDFWRYDVTDRRWEQLHRDDGCAHYGTKGRYPSIRRVPVMESVGDALYLFGGINCFMGSVEEGFSLPLNDLWRCAVED
jgi:N-acetylneuraminic acid mutarotase